MAVVLLLAGSLVASGSRGALVAAFAGCVVYLLASRRTGGRSILAGGDGALRRRDARDAAAAAGGAEPRALRGVRQDAEPRAQGHQQPAAARERVRFPGRERRDGEDPHALLHERAAAGLGDRRRAGTRSGRSRATGSAPRTRRSSTGRTCFVSDAVENSFIGVFLQLGVLGRRAARRRARAAAGGVVARALEARSGAAGVRSRVRGRRGRRHRARGAAVLPDLGRQPARRRRSGSPSSSSLRWRSRTRSVAAGMSERAARECSCSTSTTAPASRRRRISSASCARR